MYKAITKTGENFIRTICSGTTNSLIVGNYSYNLPFSSISNFPTSFTASTLNDVGNPILTNVELGEALIVWYNFYGEKYNVDANFLAAQGYCDSKYNLWHYSKYKSGSGIADTNAMRVFSDVIYSTNPYLIDDTTNPLYSAEQINTIINGIDEPYNRLSYKYNGIDTTPQTIIRATNNTEQLHQNVINNPKIFIELQALILTRAIRNNNGIFTSGLFASRVNKDLTAKSYPLLLDISNRRFGDTATKDGINYVEKILRYLSDKDNNKAKLKLDKPKGIWFGYNYTFTTDKFNSFLG